jgi:hypothetical protein
MSNKKADAQNIESIVTAKSVGSLHEEIKAQIKAKIADPPQGGLDGVVVWEQSVKNPVHEEAREIAKEKRLMEFQDQLDIAAKQDEDSRRR